MNVLQWFRQEMVVIQIAVVVMEKGVDDLRNI